MQDTEVYIKTDAGRDEIKSRTLGLPMPVRAILLMVDGQRSVSSMRSLIAGSKAPADVLDGLVAQGLIEPRNGFASAPAAPPVATPIVSTPISAPVAAPPVAAVTAPPAPTPVAPPIAAAVVVRPVAPIVVVPPVVSYDGPLDLVLPTIYGPEVSPPLAVPPEAAVQAIIEAPTTLNRYEHLYTMMNEIVRDFLAPHRRYFLQLKIERCGTPEELLELLHDVQTALAKARGEAFASDVIARLRNAAG